jgi:hypothetical protein
MKHLIRSVENAVSELEGTHALLLVIGFIGIISHWAHLPIDDFSVLLLSLLCIGIGLGQLKLASMSNTLTAEVRRSTHGFVVEEKVVWPTLTLLVENAKERIRATHLTTLETDDRYLEAITRQLEDGTHYRVIIGYAGDALAEAQKLASDRTARFTKSGVKSDKYDFRYMGIVWGLDLLIVDDQHLFIGFPVMPQQNDIRSGVVFWSKPDLVKRVLEWYDTHLWEEANS